MGIRLLYWCKCKRLCFPFVGKLDLSFIYMLLLLIPMGEKVNCIVWVVFLVEKQTFCLIMWNDVSNEGKLAFRVSYYFSYVQGRGSTKEGQVEVRDLFTKEGIRKIKQ